MLVTCKHTRTTCADVQGCSQTRDPPGSSDKAPVHSRLPGEGAAAAAAGDGRAHQSSSASSAERADSQSGACSEPGEAAWSSLEPPGGAWRSLELVDPAETKAGDQQKPRRRAALRSRTPTENPTLALNARDPARHT